MFFSEHFRFGPVSNHGGLTASRISVISRQTSHCSPGAVIHRTSPVTTTTRTIL